MPRICETCGEELAEPAFLGAYSIEQLLAESDDTRLYQLTAIRRGEDPPHSSTIIGLGLAGKGLRRRA